MPRRPVAQGQWKEDLLWRPGGLMDMAVKDKANWIVKPMGSGGTLDPANATATVAYKNPRTGDKITKAFSYDSLGVM